MVSENMLVVYYARRTYPLRKAVESHLFCWKRLSGASATYVNAALPVPGWIAKRGGWDAVILHTSFLGRRWDPKVFARVASRCAFVKDLDCIKIAMPQDEFLQTDLLCDFINDFGVTHVLTAALEEDWPRIYHKVNREKVQFKTVLTGYLDSETLELIERRKKQVPARDVDIGYRAWKAEPWLGEHGMHKRWIAEVFEEKGREAGLKTDISLRPEDTIAGDAWFDFLLRCRTVLGVEAGASVLDAKGEIRERVLAYVDEHPEASFEEVREACFAGEDGKLKLQVMGPRHLEACATETCQLLIEGQYNGILEAGKHYIPIKKDYSNAREVAEAVKDEARVKGIARQAYEDVVLSGKWSYEVFVRDIEETILNQAGDARSSGLAVRLVHAYLRFRDFLGWGFIRFEVAVARMMPKRLRNWLAKYL